MIIERMEISGFGRLHHHEVELSEGVTVLYGQNEAGKSTMLQFIRSMLFGIPGRANPSERYEPVKGGLHGGILTVRDEEGGSWKIRRYMGSGDGPGRSEKLNITVNRPDGTLEEPGQGELERELLGGISRSMFRELFAISLDELQELAALQSEEMSSYLFHAGMGGGGDIMRAERRLIQEAEKLYKPRGKVQETAKILQAMDKLERQIAESRSFLPRYNDNIQALEETEGELAQLEKQREITGRSRVRLRKAQDIRELWLKWTAARLEIAGLPAIASFPEDGAARWKLLDGEIRNSEGIVARAERLRNELAAELAANFPDELLAAQGPAVERLDRRRSSYEDRRSERQRLEGELGALREQLQRLLRGIDAGWGREELAAFSCAAGDREAARRYAAAFTGYDRSMEALGAARQTLRSRQAAAAASLQAAERALAREHAAGAAQFAALRPAGAREVQQLWDELQQAAERWREAQLRPGPQSGPGAGGDAAMRQRMAALYRRLLLAGAALTALLPAALWLTGAPPASAWIALGLLAAADLALWAGWRGARRPEAAPPEHGGAGAAAEMLRLRGQLLSGAEPESGNLARRSAAPSSSPDAGGLEAGMKELRRLMDAWGAWRVHIERLSSVHEASRTEVDTLAAQEKALVQEMNQAEAAFTETADRYEEWLRQRGLAAGLSPEGLPDIFSTVEQGNELLRQENKLVLRLRELERENTAFEQECMTLMAEDPESGLNQDAAEIPALAVLNWLEARTRAWESLKTELLRREGLAVRQSEVEDELAESRRELAELRLRSESLLREGGAADGEEFLRRSSAVQMRGELTKSVRQWELAMFAGWDKQGISELLALLDQYDAFALEKECSAAEELAAGEDETRSGLLERRGKLLQEREYLKERCLEDTVIQQLEEQRAGLRMIAEQYAVVALTAELIGRTRRIYEQDKQPQVLLLASAYFEKLTHGEYRRVVMTFGHKELKAEHKDAGLLDSGLLSRGTAEQLYLALRLALAETMSRHIRLPLLFDDLFVNFDERRLHAALSLMNELSASRQIVMMTCHRHVAEAAARLIPAASIISV